MTASQPTITLNNGVELPPSGSVSSRPRRMSPRQPSRRHFASGTGCRHRGLVPQRTRSRRRDRRERCPAVGCSFRRRSGSATTATTSITCVRCQLPQARGGHRRPLPPSPTAAPGVRRTVAAYRALNGSSRTGVSGIGISNFSPAPSSVFPRLAVVPAVNQIEVHPYDSQPALRARHAQRGIMTQAWLTARWRVRVRGPERAPRNALAEPDVTAIAERHGRPGPGRAAVALDSGRSAIPKWYPARIAQNLDVSTSPSRRTTSPRSRPRHGVREGPTRTDLVDFRTFDRTIPD